MYPTLASTLWQNPTSPYVRVAMLAIAGSVLLAISAKIQVPFYPVPITMQTFVVLSIGMLFGWRLGGATIMLYLAEGFAGLPVFAGTPEKGIGVAYMMGTTGGYLIGYLLSAIMVGFLAERGWDREIWKTVAAMILGNIVIYTVGLLWLGILLGWDKPILEWGLYPFVLGDLLKVGLAAAIFPAVWRWLSDKQ